MSQCNQSCEIKMQSSHVKQAAINSIKVITSTKKLQTETTLLRKLHIIPIWAVFLETMHDFASTYNRTYIFISNVCEETSLSSQGSFKLRG